ncbi:type II toxin-antitoxin system toxin TscT [Staphylococcus equorum]|uniref:type II toxin-antitoxin system toxin TscT n=1 Tax=Staphylococcus equorum TaxID=246432 RepID=UPI0039AFA7E8
MNFEINDLIMQFEVLKESLEDVKTKHGWFDEDYFTYEGDCVLTKDEVIRHGSAYHEHRIHSKQTFDLLRLYLNEFDRLIVNFKELDIEKNALSQADQSKDNA